MCKIVAVAYILLWIITNIGVILNKVYVNGSWTRNWIYRWDEQCTDLFTYLLVMSFFCLSGVLVYLYLSFVRYASDTRWLLLSALGTITAVSLSLFLCWGVVKLIAHSAILGVYQCFACIDDTDVTVEEICDSSHSCEPGSWSLIYSLSECSPATDKGIFCELATLCYFTAPQTFWYALVSTGLYMLVLLLTAVVIFTRLIPSFMLQSTQRSRIT